MKGNALEGCVRFCDKYNNVFEACLKLYLQICDHGGVGAGETSCKHNTDTILPFMLKLVSKQLLI